MKKHFAFLAITCGLLFQVGFLQAENRPATKPNIVFILADDLGSYDAGGAEVKSKRPTWTNFVRKAPNWNSFMCNRFAHRPVLRL